ncbi:MAG: hypothetical protein GKR88_20415 [Flavobacteriaceae bacterium]|nr:MAG: hypothetical protein GKR88_20415 [Flavobacteriaceae bacterium]
MDDVSFGTIVSGRSMVEIPDINSMVGLFTNLVPARVQVDANISFFDWLKLIQEKQMQRVNFEHTPLHEIVSWLDDDTETKLFDSLLVVENYPFSTLNFETLSLDYYKGSTTTIYPITMMVRTHNNLEFVCKYNSQLVSGDVVNWFIEEFAKLLSTLEISYDTPVRQVIETIMIAPENSVVKISSDPGNDADQANFSTAKNSVELELTKIWEKTLGKHFISVTHDFFEIGGNSLLAVRLFSKIHEELGYNIPPITLLKNRTIRTLAKSIVKDHFKEQWSSLVPLKTSGKNPPLFCLHTGEAHVFNYNSLIKHLSEEQPLYALQPVGLDGKTPFHKSIEEMSGHYIKEIQSVQPKGPYFLLAYCHLPAALSVEIAYQLKKISEASTIIAVDSRPGIFIRPTTKERIKRISSLLLKADLKEVAKGVSRRIQNHKKKKIVSEKGIKLHQKNQLDTLETIRDYFAILLHKYDWQDIISSGVVLILSTYYKERSADYLPSWEKLVEEGKFENFTIQGNHYKLFEEPLVKELARIIQTSLDKERTEENKK